VSVADEEEDEEEEEGTVTVTMDDGSVSVRRKRSQRSVSWAYTDTTADTATPAQLIAEHIRAAAEVTPSRYVTDHLGQLSLPFLPGR